MNGLKQPPEYQKKTKLREEVGRKQKEIERTLQKIKTIAEKRRKKKEKKDE